MFAFIWKLLGRFFFAGYVGNQNAFPKPLSPAEEEACIRLYVEGTETEREAAREKLILHNLRLCAHIAKKYARTGREQDDLVSIGTIGLIKAVNTFSPQKGALSGYASRCIENEIRMSLRLEKKLVSECSLEEPLGRDREGNELTVLDLVGSDEEAVFEAVGRRMEKETLARLMEAHLKKREKLVLTLRYGLGGRAPMAQREVASLLGISRSYISRIEKKAMEKLRRALEREQGSEASASGMRPN